MVTDRSRGTTPALTYVLALGVSTILVSALIVASSGYVDDRRERAVRTELQTLGERLAASVAAADRVAGSGGSVTRRTTVPNRIAGEGYDLAVVDCPGGDACIRLTSGVGSTDVEVVVPVDNESAFSVVRGSTRAVTVEVAGGPPPSVDADADATVDPDLGVGADVDPDSGVGGTVNVRNRPPSVNGFVYEPAPPSVNEVVAFDSDVRDFDDEALTYEWDLDGDGTAELTGNRSVAGQTTYTYTDAGEYPVTLTVTDDDGGSDSITKRVRASGLVYLDDARALDRDGDGTPASVAFGMRNGFASEPVRITEVLVDPQDDGIDRLDEEESYSEVQFEAVDANDTSGEEDFGDGTGIPDEGEIVSLDGPAEIGPGNRVAVNFSAFESGGAQVDVEDETFDVGVRYEITRTVGGSSVTDSFVSRFEVTPGQQGVQVNDTDVTLGPDDREVVVNVTGEDLNGQLSYARVKLLDENGDLLNETSDSFEPQSVDEVTGLRLSPPSRTIRNEDSLLVSVYDDEGNAALEQVEIPDPVSSPPAIDDVTVERTTDHAVVDFEVSDGDDNLRRVVLEVNDVSANGGAGEVDGRRVVDVSGGSASRSEVFVAVNESFEDDYVLDLVVEDEVGNTETGRYPTPDDPTRSAVVDAVNFGGGEVTYDGVAYRADQGGNANVNGGSDFVVDDPEDADVDGAAEAEEPLFTSERYASGSSFDYERDVDDGTYEVTIRYAEIYFDSEDARVFDVAIEGDDVEEGLDIVEVAGDDFTAYRVTYTVDVDDGELNVAFIDGEENNAKASAITVRRT